MNLQIFIILFSFLREIFFDKKEEADFRSQHFKPKRWVAFFFTVTSVSLCIFLSFRIFNLSKEHIKLKESFQQCEEKVVKKPVQEPSNGEATQNRKS